MTDWGQLTEDQREALWELKRHQPTMPWRRVARQLKVDPFSPCCQRRAREYVDKRRAEYLDELRRQYPEAFNRPYHQTAGLPMERLLG